MKKYKKKIKLFAIGIGCLILVIIACHYIVVWNASGKTYDNVEEIPHNKVGLLLATSPITPGGAHNYYFENRIKAADELYKVGKIDFIIASGGDYTRSQKNGCDEPAAIRDSLIARGIPDERIILDYEGLRTLNSIAKAKQVYDLDSLTLISQNTIMNEPYTLPIDIAFKLSVIMPSHRQYAVTASKILSGNFLLVQKCSLIF